MGVSLKVSLIEGHVISASSYLAVTVRPLTSLPSVQRNDNTLRGIACLPPSLPVCLFDSAPCIPTRVEQHTRAPTILPLMRSRRCPNCVQLKTVNQLPVDTPANCAHLFLSANEGHFVFLFTLAYPIFGERKIASRARFRWRKR